MTTRQPSSGTRRIVALPGSRIERHACTHDVAEIYARRRRHPAARVIPRLLATVAVRVAAMCRTLPRVPAVPLDAEPQERHRKRLRLRSTCCSRGNAACRYARPSIRPLVGAPPLANAPSNRTRQICRRECSRRMSRGRAPPVQPNLAAAPQSSQIRPQRQARKQDGGTAQPHILPHPPAVVQE